MTDFKTFIARTIVTFGTADRVAEAIGMSPSAFSRGVRNAGTLSVENLLKLAAVAGEPPGSVLRMAGKGEVATLIEQLFGAGTSAPLNARQRELLELWDQISADSDETADAALTVFRGLCNDASSRSKPRRHRAS